LFVCTGTVLLTQKISSHRQRLGCKDSLQHARRFENVSSQGSGVFRHSWLALPSPYCIVHDGIRRKICTTVDTSCTVDTIYSLCLLLQCRIRIFEIIRVPHVCVKVSVATCCWTNCVCVCCSTVCEASQCCLQPCTICWHSDPTVMPWVHRF
jgi:hypothetical protein